MKKAVNLLLVAILVFTFMSCSKEKSGEMTWYGLEEGIELAEKQNKLVLLDNYADWCGWCKRMDSDVFSDEEVAKILGKDFIAIKLDVESPEKVTYKGKEYLPKQLSAEIFSVRGLPTFSILDKTGTPLGQLVGYSPKQEFLKKVGNYVK